VTEEAEQVLIRIAREFDMQITGDAVWEYDYAELARNANTILDHISDHLLDYRSGWAFDAERES
jgi:hypothetical protein